MSKILRSFQISVFACRSQIWKTTNQPTKQTKQKTTPQSIRTSLSFVFFTISPFYTFNFTGASSIYTKDISTKFCFLQKPITTAEKRTPLMLFLLISMTIHEDKTDLHSCFLDKNIPLVFSANFFPPCLFSFDFLC